MENNFKLLLATDYSEAVMNAERYAVQFAHSTNSVLSIIHVYELPYSSLPSNPDELHKIKNNYRLAELARLEQHRKKLLRSLSFNGDDVKIECKVREGSTAKQIQKEASESNADFIVVGTHGATGFRKVFFGTHAWQTIKTSHVPVLAIPKDGLYTGIKNIVFATEQREEEIMAINFMVEIAKIVDAEITVLHISNYAVSKSFEAEMFKRFVIEIKDKVHYPKLNLRLAHYEDITSGLNDFCIRTKADLLVMSPKKPSITEKIFAPTASVTKEMSFNTHIPLLALPDYYEEESSDFWRLFEMDEEYF